VPNANNRCRVIQGANPGYRSTTIVQASEVERWDLPLYFYWDPCDYPITIPGQTWSTPNLQIPCSAPDISRCPLYADPCCFNRDGIFDNGLESGCDCALIFEWENRYWLKCGNDWYFRGDWGKIRRRTIITGPLDGGILDQLNEEEYDEGPCWIPYLPEYGVPVEFDPRDGYDDQIQNLYPCQYPDCAPAYKRNTTGRVIPNGWVIVGPTSVPYSKEYDRYWIRPNCSQYQVIIESEIVNDLTGFDTTECSSCGRIQNPVDIYLLSSRKILDRIKEDGELPFATIIPPCELFCTLKYPLIHYDFCNTANRIPYHAEPSNIVSDIGAQYFTPRELIDLAIGNIPLPIESGFLVDFLATKPGKRGLYVIPDDDPNNPVTQQNVVQKLADYLRCPTTPDFASVLQDSCGVYYNNVAEINYVIENMNLQPQGESCSTVLQVDCCVCGEQGGLCDERTIQRGECIDCQPQASCDQSGGPDIICNPDNPDQPGCGTNGSGQVCWEDLVNPERCFCSTPWSFQAPATCFTNIINAKITISNEEFCIPIACGNDCDQYEICGET